MEVVDGKIQGKNFCFILDVPASDGPGGRHKMFLAADSEWSLKAWVRALVQQGVAESAQTEVDNFFEFWYLECVLLIDLEYVLLRRRKCVDRS